MNTFYHLKEQNLSFTLYLNILCMFEIHLEILQTLYFMNMVYVYIRGYYIIIG